MASPAPWHLAGKLPAYLGFFQIVHNARRRGRTLLEALLTSLVA
jgi:hypothetical protein